MQDYAFNKVDGKQLILLPGTEQCIEVLCIVWHLHTDGKAVSSSEAPLPLELCSKTEQLIRYLQL